MPLLCMVRLWASESRDTWWYKTYPTKYSAEIICSGCWLLCCSSSEIPSSGSSWIGSRNPPSSPHFPIQPVSIHLILQLTCLDLLVNKQIIKKAGGRRANPPPLLGPISSWVERKASLRLLPWHLCLLSQVGVWERGRRLVLRPSHLPCHWAYPNSERLDRSWKNSPSQELRIFHVLLLFTASRPSSLPTAEPSRNSLHYLPPCFSCHFY